MRQATISPSGLTAVSRPLGVPHGSIGRGHAGKSVLLRAARRRSLQRRLPSGLRFDLDDPRRTADVVKESRSTQELLQRRGLPATLETDDVEIELFAGERKVAVLQSREAVGQVYSHTFTSSAADQQERFRQHLEYLAQVSVLWTVLSVPAEGSPPAAFSRYEDDLVTLRASLRESLRLRRPGRSCAVSIVITKMDTLFDSPDAAIRSWPNDEVIKRVRPLVSLIQESKSVEWATINPVSALGFGTAELLEPSTADARPEACENEPEWVLRPDAVIEPWNIISLMAWTFLAGMACQEVTPEEGADLAMVCRMLREDLVALDGWQIPIKGEF